MKKKIAIVLVVLFNFVFINKSAATHVAAVEISYLYVGKGKEAPGDLRPYQLFAKVFKDCNATATIPIPLPVTVTSTPYPDYTIVNLVPDIRLDGNGLPTNTGSPGNKCLNIPSPLPGGPCLDVEQFWYKMAKANGDPDTIWLPTAPDWRFYWATCCRPSAATNIPGDQPIYAEARLNNDYDVITMGPNEIPADVQKINRFDASSANFEDPNSPMPGFCVGRKYAYKIPAVFEHFNEETDSISFVLAAPLAAPGVAVTYSPGFSPTSPFESSTPIYIDEDGFLHFTPVKEDIPSLNIEATLWRKRYFKTDKCYDPNLNCDPTDPNASAPIPTLDSVYEVNTRILRDTRFQFTIDCNIETPVFEGLLWNNANQGWEYDCASRVLDFEIDNFFTDAMLALCGSIDPLGSDFRLSKGTVEVPTDPQEISHVVVSCRDDGTTRKIAVHLAKPIKPGNYNLFLDLGTDYNTILSECGIALPQHHIYPIHINTNYEYEYTGIDPIRVCNPANPDPIVNSKLEFADSIRWVTINKNQRDTVNFTSYNVQKSAIPFDRNGTWQPRNLTLDDKFDVDVEIEVFIAGGCTDKDNMEIEFTKNAPVNVPPNYDLCFEEDWPIINMDTVDHSTGGSFQVWSHWNPKIDVIDSTWEIIKTQSPILNTAQSGSGWYEYKVELNNGVCVERDTFRIARNPIIVKLASDTAVCIGDSILLVNQIDNFFPENIDYEWFKDDVLIPGETESFYKIGETGTYTLIGTKNDLCIDTTTSFVQYANYLETPGVVCSKIYFKDGQIRQLFSWPTVSGADDYEVSVDGGFNWEAPNGLYGIHHEVVGPQITLSVRAVNYEKLAEGSPCEYSDIGFAEACEIIVKPLNVFTPNGDGINDLLRFDLLEVYPGSKLQLYDRWGKMIYESSDYKNDFDGKDLNAGVYYYVLDINDPSYGIFKGSVTLLR